MIDFIIKLYVYYDEKRDELLIAPSPEKMGCSVLRENGKYEKLIYIGEL